MKRTDKSTPSVPAASARHAGVVQALVVVAVALATVSAALAVSLSGVAP